MNAMRSMMLAAASVLTFWAYGATPVDANKDTQPSVAAASGLPKVLIIGDSISIGYTEPVKRLLQKEADVRRIPVNGQSSDYGLANIDAWLGQEKWDVIHFNWGIWDTHIIKGAKIRNTTDEYRAHLRILVKRLKDTGASLIWASTTPIARDTSGGDLGLVKTNTPIYNDVAKSVMEELRVPIDDLFGLALPQLKSNQSDDAVHFTDEGSEVLAKQVAESIRKALKKNPSPAAAH